MKTKLKAILGPTNTGKTFYAMERMLAHKSGMIGFPLRLLARENYDKAIKMLALPKLRLSQVRRRLFLKMQNIFVVLLKQCLLIKNCISFS